MQLTGFVQNREWKIAVVFLSGILLMQYFHNRSLWIDEAMLSLNLLNRSPGALLRPLDDFQVAPVLFLLVEKFDITVFGNSEYALRLFPVICSLISLPLFYKLCLRLTGDAGFSLCCLILLGCTPAFLYYSSEVKQYAVDLLIMLILYLGVIDTPAEESHPRAAFFAVTGAVAIFISNVSVVVLFTIGLYFLFLIWKSKKITRSQWLPAAVWVLCFAINYFLFVKNHPHTHFMRDYWKLSFMPSNPISMAFRRFADKTVVEVFRDLVPAIHWGYLFISGLCLYIWGLIVLVYRKSYRVLYFCLAPVMIHLLLSAFKLYPFSGRLILYQAPLYIIVMMSGLWHSLKQISRASIRWSIALVVIALPTVDLFLHFPMDHDEIRPAIADINRLSNAGESVYVFWGGIPATAYYIETGRAHFERLHMLWGAPAKGSATYLNDLQPVRGRIWLLVSHLYPYNGNRDDETEVVHYMLGRGVMLNHGEYPGASLYRFDLK